MPTENYLIDTSAWIFALTKKFNPAIKDRISRILSSDKVLTTGIIKLELLGGTKIESEFNRLKTRLDALGELETNQPLWSSAYNLAFSLRRSGLTVPYTDILIASCALEAEAIVAHADHHFDMISQKSDLRVESFLHLV